MGASRKYIESLEGVETVYVINHHLATRHHPHAITYHRQGCWHSDGGGPWRTLIPFDRQMAARSGFHPCEDCRP